VSQRGWAILTKDRRIRRHPAEVAAWRAAGAAVFVLRSGDATAEAMAKAFIAARTRMLRWLDSHTRPLVVMISPVGGVRLLVGERRGGVKR
jgi:hypothetical protein